MKRALILLALSLMCDAMETPPGDDEPLSPRSFHAAFYHIKKRFEIIEHACKHQTDKSQTTVATIVSELHNYPHQELVSVLWHKHYRDSTLDQCRINNDGITEDLAIVNSARLRNLLGHDQDCLERARVAIGNTTALNETIWNKIESISFISPNAFSGTLAQEFIHLRTKLDFLFNKVFAKNPEALELIDSINSDILHSNYAIFIPLLWDPRIVRSAAKSHQNYQNSLTLTIKQKIDELQEKVNKIKDHHP